MDLAVLVSTIDLHMILQAMAIVLSLCALVVSWSNRRSQRSARLVAEVLPEDDGVYLYVSNVGERVAYDVDVSIEPDGLLELVNVVSTIAPQTSFRTMLCAYSNLPAQPVRVTMRCHDPQHKRRLVKRIGTFDTLSMESHRVARPASSACSTILE